MCVKIQTAVLLLLVAILSGCTGGSTKIPDPEMDPVTVAQAILDQYDSDSSGDLSKSELKASKGLNQLAQNEHIPLDQDGNSSISSDELAKKFADFVEVKRDTFHCIVKYRNQPLPEATVRLVPEAFMGDAIPTASGQTDVNGNSSLGTDDGLPGVVAGVYKVEITHPDLNLPAKYNEETTLGIAIDSTNPYASFPTFLLK